MSCQIKGIANIPDVDNVKKLLYGDAVSKCEFFVNIISMISYLMIYTFLSVEYIPNDELPLQDCIISLSSVGDVLTMAWNTKMIIFVCRYKFYII